MIVKDAWIAASRHLECIYKEVDIEVGEQVEWGVRTRESNGLREWI